MRISWDSSLERAQAAAYIICYPLIDVGCLIDIDKSQLVPLTWVRFMGLVCDFVRQVLLIPEDEKVMFAASREDIFQSPLMVLKAVQRFSVKVISFGLATSGCKLYVRHVFNVMSNLSGSTRFSVKVEGGRHNEIEFSHFLQN